MRSYPTALILWILWILPGHGIQLANASELTKLADEITVQMMALRELPLKTSRHKINFKKSAVNRGALEGYLRARFREEYPADELANEEEVLKGLKLIPAELNYQQAIVDFILNEVAGYYDPFKHTLYMVEGLAPNLQRPVLAHEITHALQDLEFNLQPFLRRDKTNSDFTLARQALVEGDATWVMHLQELKARGATDQEILALQGSEVIDGFLKLSIDDYIKLSANHRKAGSARNPYLEQMAYFPYVEGAKFTYRLYQTKRGWTLVNRAFSLTPNSTQEILHPEKYLSRIENQRAYPATMVKDELSSFGARSGANFQATFQEIVADVVGEFGCQLLVNDPGLCQHWQIDQSRLVQNKTSGHRSIILASLWTDIQAARGFANALKHRLEANPLFPVLDYQVVGESVRFILAKNKSEQKLIASALPPLASFRPHPH